MKRQYFTRPYRIRRKRQIFKSRFFWLSLLFPIVFGGIFYFFLFSDFFQVEKVIVTGEGRGSMQDIKSIAEGELENKILFFKTKSIFLVNADKIRDNLLERFPQIGEVEIKKGYPDALNLAITERKEIGVFCRETDCFLLDHEGVIFEPASAELSLLRFQNQTLLREMVLGSEVIDKEVLSSISEIVSKLNQDLKILLDEVLIVSGEDIEVKTGEGWEIYFNPKRGLSWQLLELTAILENRIPPEKRKNLKYIDLRFDKVYIFPETYNQ